MWRQLLLLLLWLWKDVHCQSVTHEECLSPCSSCRSRLSSTNCSSAWDVRRALFSCLIRTFSLSLSPHSMEYYMFSMKEREREDVVRVSNKDKDQSDWVQSVPSLPVLGQLSQAPSKAGPFSLSPGPDWYGNERHCLAQWAHGDSVQSINWRGQICLNLKYLVCSSRRAHLRRTAI